MTDKTTRRTVLASVPALLLAGCSSDSSTDDAQNDAGDNADESQDSPTEEPTESPTATPEPSLGIGDSFQVGDGDKKMEYTVNSFNFADKIESEYSTKEPSGVYAFVEITMKNVGKESISLTSNAFKLLSPEDAEYEADIEGMTYHEDGLSIEQMHPDLSKSGVLVFDVAPDKSYRLQVSPAGVFSGAEPKLVELN